MKISIGKLTLFAVVLAIAVFAKRKEDERLGQVEKVFVAGNSYSANTVRETIMDMKTNTHWKNRCITGVSNKDLADATLEIVESVPIGGNGSGSGITPQSSGTLTLKSGDVIWGNNSMFAGNFILKRLNEAVCRAKGIN
jgi:hypothetical protein